MFTNFFFYETTYFSTKWFCSHNECKHSTWISLRFIRATSFFFASFQVVSEISWNFLKMVVSAKVVLETSWNFVKIFVSAKSCFWVAECFKNIVVFWGWYRYTYIYISKSHHLHKWFPEANELRQKLQLKFSPNILRFAHHMRSILWDGGTLMVSFPYLLCASWSLTVRYAKIQQQSQRVWELVAACTTHEVEICMPSMSLCQWVIPGTR